MAQVENVGKGEWENLPLRAMGVDPVRSGSGKRVANSRREKRSHGFFGFLDNVLHKEKQEPFDQLEHYLGLAQKHPENATFHLKLAEIYQKKGEEQKAISKYLQAAEIFSREDFLPQAMSIYKQVLSLNSHLVQANLKMGEIYRKMGCMADALSQYKIVLKHYQQWGKQEKVPEVMKLIHEVESQKFRQEQKVQGPSKSSPLPEGEPEIILLSPSQMASPPRPTKEDAPAGEKEDTFFDLSAELGASEPRELKEIKEISTDKLSGFEEIFKELQATVIHKEIYPDFNYRMGVACREMGFNDGAIEHLQIAFEEGQNPAESAKLLSKCFREKGWFHEAQKYFEKALQVEDDSGSRTPGFKSELVLVHS